HQRESSPSNSSWNRVARARAQKACRREGRWDNKPSVSEVWEPVSRIPQDLQGMRFRDWSGTLKAGLTKRLKLNGAAILVFRVSKSLKAAPAAYRVVRRQARP